jgi:hypothetical protein
METTALNKTAFVVSLWQWPDVHYGSKWLYNTCMSYLAKQKRKNDTLNDNQLYFWGIICKVTLIKESVWIVSEPIFFNIMFIMASVII